MNKPVANEDLDLIFNHLGNSISNGGNAIRQERILLTGATGFFGKWLTQTLLAGNDRLALGNQCTILTRNKERALLDSPWLRGRNDFDFIESDIRELKMDRRFSTIIHGAAAASRDLNENHPEVMFDTILDGTRRVLELSEKSQTRRFLFISSGAVYGRQPDNLTHVPETYAGAPDTLDAKSAYGEAKRGAEFLCASVARRTGIEMKIARCYAFIGPYLPVDSHFAAGNFLAHVLKNETIQIGGDGTPLRSYLYAADLMVWLLRILAEAPANRAYNVGSENALSIADLARATHAAGCIVNPALIELKNPIHIAKTPLPEQPREQYVPSAQRAKSELKLEAWTPLKQALLKTLRWHQIPARIALQS